MLKRKDLEGEAKRKDEKKKVTNMTAIEQELKKKLNESCIKSQVVEKKLRESEHRLAGRNAI